MYWYHLQGEARAPKKTAAEKKRKHAKDSDDSEPDEIRIGSDSDDEDTGKSAFERRDGRRESKKPKQGGSGRPWEKSERKPREPTGGHRMTRKKRRKMEAKEVGFGSISRIKMAKKKQQTQRIRMH